MAEMHQTLTARRSRHSIFLVHLCFGVLCLQEVRCEIFHLWNQADIPKFSGCGVFDFQFLEEKYATCNQQGMSPRHELKSAKALSSLQGQGYSVDEAFCKFTSAQQMAQQRAGGGES